MPLRREPPERLEVDGGAVARWVVGQLVNRYLGFRGIVEEPEELGAQGGNADVHADGHVIVEHPWHLIRPLNGKREDISIQMRQTEKIASVFSDKREKRGCY